MGWSDEVAVVATEMLASTCHSSACMNGGRR